MKKSAKITLVSVTAAAAVTAAALAVSRASVLPAAETEWAVYWYVCGSDLEENFQAASEDIGELLSAGLPENVKVVLETGGSREWKNRKVSPEKICRYSVSGGSLTEIAELEQKNMGDPETLSDFLSFCIREHPAKHTALVLWDHGGGTLGGVAYDKNYRDDSISLPELSEALGKALTREDGTVGKLDLIGFDACLMSTLDTFTACAPYAGYMIGSQQLEPVCGWNYRGLCEALSGAENVSVEMLGKAVCDAFYEGCAEIGLEKAATLALVDLGKANGLVTSYEETIRSCFDASLLSDESMASVRRSADSAENYGVNGKAVGYTDMIDMLEFLSEEAGVDTSTLRDAISEAVIYQVTGDRSAGSCGISCYYPLDQSLRSVIQYENVSGLSGDIALFYRYLLNPEVSEEVTAYARRRGIGDDSILSERYQIAAEDLRVVVPEDPKEDIVLSVEPEKAAKMAGFKTAVSTVRSLPGKEKVSVTENGERICSLEDYENGEFRFDRNLKLAFLGDIELPTYISSVDDKFIRYYSPVVIDGNDGFFLFSVERETEEFTFLGQYRGEEHIAGEYHISDEDGEIGNISAAQNISAEGADAAKSFIGKRLHPLREGEEVRALTRTAYVSPGDFSKAEYHWEESEPLFVNGDSPFRYRQYDYEKMEDFIIHLVSFRVTDECGREVVSEPEEFLPEGVIGKKPEPETAPETETPTEPETAPETETETPEQTAAPKTVPETAPETVPETTPETSPSTEESTSEEEETGEWDDRDDWEDDEDDEPVTPAPTEKKTEPPTKEPPTKEPSSTEPSGEDPSGEDPSGEDPSGENPSGEDPSGENPSGEDPSGENPSGENPSGENPSGENPSGENPSGENPSGENPSNENPARDPTRT